MSDWAATERLPGEVSLAEGITITGDLHLQGGVALHNGPETPLEMLNRPDPFFPVTLAGGETVFVSKALTAVVSCYLSPLADADRLYAAREVGLEVMMEGGAEFRGRATLELSPTRGRTLDYLNAADPFFTIRTDAVTRFIHRAHVRVIRPLD